MSLRSDRGSDARAGARAASAARPPAARFAIPAPPRRTIERARLLERLDGLHEHPLTLLCAPAGSGKTTLLASWVAAGRARWPVCWLSLDPADDSRRELWDGLLLALGGVGLDEPLAALEADPRGSAELLAAALAALPQPLVLVLDDAHEVVPATLAALEPLLRHPLPNLRLVIATRGEPGLALGRLRLADDLLELRADALAFDGREAQALLAAHGVELEQPRLERLLARTQGWPAPTSLAVQALRDAPEGGDGHAPATGSGGEADRSLADYLRGEILDRQDAATRAFLLRSAIADPLDAGLADVLSGRDDGALTLARLRREGVPLAALEGGERYRHHPLLTELLRAQLRAEHPGELAELHRTAARWLAAHGQLAAALDHALQSEDVALACELARADVLRLVLDGDARLLAPLLAHVAPGDAADDPELALALAAAQLDGGATADGRWLALAHEHEHADAVPAERREAFALVLTCADLTRARLRGDVGAARAVGARLAVPHPALGDAGLDAALRCVAATGVGLAELWHGELTLAIEQLEDAVEAARVAERDWLTLLASAGLSLACGLAGEIARCEQAGERAVAIATRRGWTATWQAGAAYGTLAALALERLDTARAERLLAHALPAVEHARDAALAALVECVRAQLLAAEGRPREALVALRAARAIGGAGAAAPARPRGRDRNRAAGSQSPGDHAAPTAPPPPSGPLRDTLARTGALLRATLGDRAGARAELEHVRIAEPAALGSRATLALLQLADGEHALARTTVAPVLRAPAPLRASARIDAWLVEARALHARGDERGSGKALERALGVLERTGLLRVALDHGAALDPLLQRHVGPDTAHRDLVEALLALRRPARGSASPGSAALREPLTDSELRVLRYLPTMMSYQEIAGELFVSLNTLKSHTRAIFRKLDAHTRREAVQRSRELALLRPHPFGRMPPHPQVGETPPSSPPREEEAWQR